MMVKFTRLFQRNGIYYIRIFIPKDIQNLVKKKLFVYSLRTANYNVAKNIIRISAPKFDLLIADLRNMQMDVYNNCLMLDENDVAQIVKIRVREIIDTNEKYRSEIETGKMKVPAYGLLQKHRTEFKFTRAVVDEAYKYVSKWLGRLYKSGVASTAVMNILEEVKKKNIDVLRRDEPLCIEWFKKVVKGLKDAEMYELALYIDTREKYLKNTRLKKADTVGSIKKNLLNVIENVANEKSTDSVISSLVPLVNKIENTYFYDKSYHPLELYSGAIKSIIEAATQDKINGLTDTVFATPMTALLKTQTDWKKVFEKFADDKRRKKTSENTINDNKTCLNLIFEMIGNPIIENLSFSKCRFVSDNIDKVPAKWNKDKQSLSEAMEADNKKLSPKRIITYLNVFNEFLNYLKIEKYTTDNFEGSIRFPKKESIIERHRFSETDMKKLFSDEYYKFKNDEDHFHRFYIPLISLYSGMRLNEICQLYIDDIKFENDIYYFRVDTTHEKQHLKNKQSKRIVPIHPNLIKVGILDIWNKAKKNNEEQLFYKLTYDTKNHFNHKMSAWFGRYTKSLGVDDAGKVFHSFRHTVKQELRNSGVNREFQNLLLGWNMDGVGEVVYGKDAPIELLYKEICTIHYDCMDEIIEKFSK